MKELLLLRHGNAASGKEAKSDHERSLDNTGRKQITNIANRLIDQNQIPNLILSSTAVRALSSASLIINIIQTTNNEKETKIKIVETELLYSASIYEYLDILKTQNNLYESIMVVAHNPAISGFISRSTGKHIGMGTGNLYKLTLDIEKWSDLSFYSSILNSTLIRP